jgi:hypothetical protein
MSAQKEKAKRCQYSPEDMQAAVEKVKNEEMTPSAAKTIL